MGQKQVGKTLRMVLACWLASQACATYDNPPRGGSGGVPGDGGGASEPGSTGTGNTSCVSQAGDTFSGGSGGAPLGAAGVGETGGGGDVPSEGGAGEGGVVTSAGAGAAETAGAGGTAACVGKAPELGCTCAEYEGHGYWLCPSFLTLSAAEARCLAVGMHLPKIESASEDDWLFATATLGSLGEYFLGATDATTPNEWSWLAGGKLWSGLADGTAHGYVNWSSNEPNGSGDCLVVQSNGPWDDRTCTDQRKYVCEAP